MALPLQDVLDDPTLAAAEPLVLAGASELARPVGWVHTSEVLDIADLLHGGELLLVGGIALAGADEDQRRTYVRSLAARSVAGLAIETGPLLPAVPAVLVEEAERCGLPLVQLRRVVRFVEVTRAINGQLVHESVHRLQLADRISHALAEALAAGAGPDELLAVLSDLTAADCDLLSATDEVVAAASADVARAGDLLAGRAVAVPVSAGGVTVAVLTLRPRQRSDLLLLEAARDRAPEALGLALLRTRPPTRWERTVREFLDVAVDVGTAPERLTDLAARLGLPAGPYVGVVVEFAASGAGAVIEAALRRRGRVTIGQLRKEQYVAVVAVADGTAGPGRPAVLADLTTATLPVGARVAVGPVADTVGAIPRSLREASVLLRAGLGGGVVDAAEFGVERLLMAVDHDDVIGDFVHEHLGALIELDRRRHSDLVDTLVVHLRHWGRKTDTAAALHLRRQSLYQRLDRIFATLGDRPAGSPQLGALMLAAELEAARRRLRRRGGGRGPHLGPERRR